MDREYRETPPPSALRGAVECAWWSSASTGTRVLPDGCMDLLLSADGALSVAGPDTRAFFAHGGAGWTAGLRFHPGALPRLLGVPARALRDSREPLSEVAPDVASALAPAVDALLTAGDPPPDRTLAAGSVPDAGHALLGAAAPLIAPLAAAEHGETAPWAPRTLAHVTARLGEGTRVADLAAEIGWSPRSLTRQCTAVYGYGPTVLRRILRFRRATDLLSAGVAQAEVAARAGYADQPHLSREVRELAGVPASALRP